MDLFCLIAHYPYEGDELLGVYESESLARAMAEIYDTVISGLVIEKRVLNSPASSAKASETITVRKAA